MVFCQSQKIYCKLVVCLTQGDLKRKYLHSVIGHGIGAKDGLECVPGGHCASQSVSQTVSQSVSQSVSILTLSIENE